MAWERDENECLNAPPIHGWFGLSYCSYFVMPRVAMEAMPHEWQRKFIGLMDEADALGMETPDYHILRSDKDYTTTQPNDPDDPDSWDREFYIQRQDEWANYRRGDIHELCPSFKTKDAA